MGKGSNFGSIVFGFMAGSIVTATAAYIMVARDMERLKKEKQRLEEEQMMGEESTRSTTSLIGSRSAAAALAASGEHVGFLTDIMKQLWSYIKVAGADSIRETVEPMFPSMMPGPLANLKFTKIDLGTVPIRMDNVVVHNVDRKSNTLQFDLDLIWDGT